ncbi:MAG: hypothetical protein AAFX65_07500 [Cyanobacteria bacterium J06638_7]
MKRFPKSAEMWRQFRAEFGDTAEQWRAPTTIRAITRDGQRRIKFAPVVPSTGQPRLRDPDTGRMVPQDGDIVALGRNAAEPILALKWRGSWHPLPSVEAVEQMCCDSTVLTPDGEELEPDADGSWLRLLCLI